MVCNNSYQSVNQVNCKVYQSSHHDKGLVKQILRANTRLLTRAVLSWYQRPVPLSSRVTSQVVQPSPLVPVLTDTWFLKRLTYYIVWMAVMLSSILYHISYYVTISATNATRLTKLNKHTEHVFTSMHLNFRNIWKPPNFVINLVAKITPQLILKYQHVWWRNRKVSPPCLESQTTYSILIISPFQNHRNPAPKDPGYRPALLGKIKHPHHCW